MIECTLVFNTSICYRYRESKSILVFKTFQHRSIDVPCDITGTKYSGNKQHDERANKTSFRYLRTEVETLTVDQADDGAMWNMCSLLHLFCSIIQCVT